jgi:peroxiredoxin
MKKLLLAAVTAFALVSTAFTPADETPAGYKTGDIARDFQLKNVDGSFVSFGSYPKAKGYIVVFTCNHCPFAKAYEQRIIDLHKKFEPKGFPVIAINPNDKDRSPEDSYELMVARAKEKKYPFAYLYDETQDIAKAYGATRTPHVYLLTRTAKGSEVAYIGAIDDNSEDAGKVKDKYVEKAIDELLNGKQVSNANTKAIGCTIKWKK